MTKQIISLAATYYREVLVIIFCVVVATYSLSIFSLIAAFGILQACCNVLSSGLNDIITQECHLGWIIKSPPPKKPPLSRY